MNKKQLIIIFIFLGMIVATLFLVDKKVNVPYSIISDCIVYPWSDLSKCSSSCGPGFATRERKIEKNNIYADCSKYPTKEDIPCTSSCGSLNVIDEKIKETVNKINSNFYNIIKNTFASKCANDIVSMQISNIRIKNANIDTLSIDNIAVLNSVCIQKNLTTTDLNTSMTQAISQYLETQSDSNINNYLAKKSDEYEGIPIAVNSTYNNKVLNYINNVVKNEVINNISSECLSNVSVYQNLDLEFDDVSINTINISNGAKAVIECVINNENVTKIIKTIMTDFYQSQKDNINLTVTNDSTKPIWAPYIKYVIYLIILIMIVIGFILFNKSQGK